MLHEQSKVVMNKKLINKSTMLIVERYLHCCADQPTIIVAGTGEPIPDFDRQYGWPGQRRRFSCSARGLPYPTIAWARNSQPVASNEFYQVTTTSSVDSSDEVITNSVLEVGKFINFGIACQVLPTQ